MEPTDAELIDACRHGDTGALEVLYRRHRDWVVAVAHRFCGQRDDALDVMQDAFAYLLRTIPDLELSGQLRSLLYPAVKHLARDRRARARRSDSLERAPEPSYLPGLPDELHALLDGLGELQQEVLSLRFADDLSLGEIAAVLGIPLGTVKSRLHNALEQLRKKPEPE